MKAEQPARRALGPVVGHAEVLAPLETLILAAARDEPVRLPHAVVFSGPEGIGKFRAALWLASRLTCESPDDCGGECVSCKKIAADSHPDLVVLEPRADQRSIGIDPVRDDLITRLSRRPALGAFNVAIVRDAHKLTFDAQSALLKTLEEPQGRALVVLVTDALGSLLATVRSRCQLLRFGPLPESEVERVLRASGVPESRIRRAAPLAAGSPGRALRMTDEQIEERERLLVDFERCARGETDMDALLNKLADPKRGDRPALPALYEWQMKKIEAAFGYPRDEESDMLSEVLSSLSADDAPRLIRHAERVHDTMMLVGRNANAKLAIRDMLMSIRDS
jgi:DNA polymerase-3 subunit delta'